MTVHNSLFRLVFVMHLCVSSIVFSQEKGFSERVKIALRQSGNELLLINKDSTSLILPILQVEANKYQISFQKEFSFEPSELVAIVQKNLQKSLLPENYRVQVLQCRDNEVGYSYEMNEETTKTIIPCSGRVLPKNCYKIEIIFLHQNSSNNNWFLSFAIFIVIILIWLLYQHKNKTSKVASKENFSKEIGEFTFYPHQNKLVKKAEEITLSNKECELLEIFVAKPNTIIKREELTKKVWEDNGVIVGRSLDTYISKLRKKLQEDNAIKLTNIHGVGYKLEIN